MPIGALRALVLEHRVLVIRGYEPLAPAELVDYCRRWGELLEWDFGFMLDVVEHPNPTNYLFTTSSVPFHWDGAFAKQAPSFQLFQCLKAGDASDGGETLFADTIAIVADADANARARWRDIRISYAMEKVAHYGGRMTAPLIGRHPVLDRETLRFSEPLREDTAKLNELELEVHGIGRDRVKELFAELRTLLYDPRYCYAHSWQAGDILIADNHALLHGRNKYPSGQRRHLQRVQVL